jgi:hypothetical protein
MADQSAPVVAHIGPGSVDMHGVRVPISNVPLPIIYFDSAPSCPT